MMMKKKEKGYSTIFIVILLLSPITIISLLSLLLSHCSVRCVQYCTTSDAVLKSRTNKRNLSQTGNLPI